MKLHAIKTVPVVIRIANSCVEQAVIFIIIVVSVKCEQWHKSSAENKDSLIETKQIFLLGLQLTNSYLNVLKKIKTFQNLCCNILDYY